MDENINIVETQNVKTKNRFKSLFLVLIIFGFCFYYFLSAPFKSKDEIIHVSNGQSINSVIVELKDKNIIRNDFILKVFIKLLKDGSGIVSGDYLISKNSPVYIVAWQLSRGHHNIEPVKITIREGLTNEEIASLLASKLIGFKKDVFLSKVNGKQGYLFPDTYFLFPLETTEEIVNKLSNNFENKTKDIKLSLGESSTTFSDIITMASILEGEANGKEDVETISGILWKRISMDMPLQVDVDRSTYTRKGLPQAPLNNPGLTTIKASLNLKSSPYLYYLHDKNGNVHYAVTFEEHKSNISKYLK